jgi:hypothetical protein
MVFVFVFLVVFSIAVAVAVGNVVAQAQNPPSVTPGNNDSGTDCGSLCLQFQARRSQRCVAQADVRNAQTRLDLLSAQRDSAQKTWAVATAAALAAMFIPFVGPVISSVFATAAGVAFTAYLGFVGAVNGASADLLTKAAIARTCLDKEAEARQLLLANCPTEASSCLATPSPC